MKETIERVKTLPLLPEIDDVTRREFLIGAAGLLVLAPYGCGGDGEQGAASGETRNVEHGMGETEVPENPGRIAALDNSSTDTMLALGVEPAGVTTYTGTDFESYEYLQDELEDVELLGQFIEPDLERVAALEPDLIIASESHEEIYDQLSQVAPTVVMEDAGGDFRRYARDLGEVLGMQDAVERRLEEYEQKADEASEELERAVGEEPVAFLRVTEDELRLYGNDRLVGPIIFGDLGLTPAPLVQELAQDENYVEVSLERIPELGAEHLFLLDQTDDEMARLTGSPLWREVPAVQEDDLYPVGRDTWIATGILAAEAVIEDVQESLAGGAG